MNSSDNKNLILAMVLMLAVWLGFSFLFPPTKQDQQPPVANQPVQTVPAKEEPTQPVVDRPAADAEVNSVTRSADAIAAETSAPAREIIVETSKYRAVFTTEGARLVSFKLKDYRTTADPDSPPIEMFEPGPIRYATFRTNGTEGFSLKDDALFESTAPGKIEVSANEEIKLSFQHVAANGMQYVKTFVLHNDRYIIDIILELKNSGPAPLRGTIDLSLIEHWNESLKQDRYSFSGPSSLVKDKIEEVKVDKLKEGPVTYGKDVSWTSFQTKYFLSVVVPGENTVERVEILRNGDAIENVLESPYFTVQAGDQISLNYLAYVGPKEPERLKAAGHRLDEVVHFGFFNILAQPLFMVLTFFYGFTKNYGISIILLTVLIKILFWPLTHKSYSSMKSMQKLQPEMQKLREKYKNDKERLNKEMMSLYKTHSVNPLGGCLPMIVQIPVFFALYKVLLDSIALRHAPFAFWLTDLSAKDPYYITPILMGVTMFVQQKMTPSTADPMQAKIFMMMPIIFTFMFLNFPSGLVIYWLVNNLLTILQQYFIHRKAT
jgi:YidC/Oxa1 family membrane protein insertase